MAKRKKRIITQKARYFQEGLRNIRTVGTISRSSPYLCRKMTGLVDFDQARAIAELGAGDGVITRHILPKLHPEGRLFAFEVLPQMAEYLHRIDDGRLIVVEDSAEFISVHLKKAGLEKVDFIISAIPFVMLPQERSLAILFASKEALRPGGLFIQVHYSLLAKKLYEEVFGNVRIQFEARNIPPAFILVCERL